jgi:hypothetical protein
MKICRVPEILRDELRADDVPLSIGDHAPSRAKRKKYPGDAGDKKRVHAPGKNERADCNACG